MSEVKGYCPSCGRPSLFLAGGGDVTCRRLDCLRPDAAADILADAGRVGQAGAGSIQRR